MQCNFVNDYDLKLKVQRFQTYSEPPYKQITFDAVVVAQDSTHILFEVEPGVRDAIINLESNLRCNCDNLPGDFLSNIDATGKLKITKVPWAKIEVRSQQVRLIVTLKGVWYVSSRGHGVIFELARVMSRWHSMN